MTTTATSQVYRVQVAFHGRTGRRAYGFTMKVAATSKQDAARLAEKLALANNADATARFNAEAARLGRPDLSREPWPTAKAESVRRYAADNPS